MSATSCTRAWRARPRRGNGPPPAPPWAPSRPGWGSTWRWACSPWRWSCSADRRSRPRPRRSVHSRAGLLDHFGPALDVGLVHALEGRGAGAGRRGDALRVDQPALEFGLGHFLDDRVAEALLDIGRQLGGTEQAIPGAAFIP